jgi:ATP-dependent Clp protease protease subunit
MVNKDIQKHEGLDADGIIGLGLLKNHTFVLSGDITEENISEALRWLIYENTSDEEKELTLYVNSTGGLLNDAFALIDMMRHSKHTIKTIGLGNVMSSAFLIFAAGTRGYRYIARNASILSHQYSEELSESKHHDIKSFTKECDNTNERMVELLKTCTDLNGSTIKRKLLPASDVWLTAEELVDLGIADHIL